MNAKTHNITTLPKWAQRRIAKAEADRDHYKRKYFAGPEDSNTFADRSGTDDTRRPLGMETEIQFVDPENPRKTLEAVMVGDTLRIRCSNGSISVTPEVSNAINVRVDHRGR